MYYGLHYWIGFIGLVICLLSPVQAQVAPETPYEKAHRILSNTPLIFEGVIVEQNFYESTPGNCWTANTIEITRIFKGSVDLKCGKVILIHAGSSGQIVDFGTGPYWQDAGSHTIEYKKGAKGIFFCKINNGFHPKPTVNPTSNPFLVSSFEQNDNFLGYNYDPRIVDTVVSLATINYYANLFAELTFNSFSEVAQFLKLNYGLDTNLFVRCEPRPSVRERNAVENPVLINPRHYNKVDRETPLQDGKSTKDNVDQSEKLDRFIVPDSNQGKTESQTEENTSVKKKILDFESRLNDRIENGLIENSSRANEEVTFTLENEEFTGTNPRFLEFDVMVSCNQLGTFLDNAPIHLSYNTNAFGSNIVANNKITVTLGSAFNDPTYEDPNSLSNDWASDTVVVLLGLDYTASMNRTQITASALEMLHVKIEIASCYEETDMFFVNQSIAENVTFFTTSATEPWTGSLFNYDDVHYDGDLDLKLCVPVINSFNNPVRGGIGDVLKIQGKHFGSTQGDGEVWFTDGARGGQVYIENQDEEDYISWSDSQIEIRVPSRVSATVNGLEVYPGSGLIGVKTDLGDSALSSSLPDLEILYSINNSPLVPVSINDSDKVRLNLIDDNGEGSYTFHCDTSISNHPLRKAIVERAIHDWNCRTEVNWKLGSDTTLQFFGQDGVNLIYFDNSLQGIPLGRTRHVQSSYCPTVPSGQVEAFSREVDIGISATLSMTNAYANGGWWYDTTGANVPIDYCDFYGVMLHELGHAHSIRHVNDPVDPMYYTLPSSPIPSSNRNYQPSK